MVFGVTNEITKVYDHTYYQVVSENMLRVKTLWSRQPCGCPRLGASVQLQLGHYRLSVLLLAFQRFKDSDPSPDISLSWLPLPLPQVLVAIFPHSGQEPGFVQIATWASRGEKSHLLPFSPPYTPLNVTRDNIKFVSPITEDLAAQPLS